MHPLQGGGRNKVVVQSEDLEVVLVLPGLLQTGAHCANEWAGEEIFGGSDVSFDALDVPGILEPADQVEDAGGGGQPHYVAALGHRWERGVALSIGPELLQVLRIGVGHLISSSERLFVGYAAYPSSKY